MKLTWPGRRVVEDLPVPEGYVMFWPTGRCNFRCLHCKLPILDEERDELTYAEITTFFSRSRVLAGLPISIAGGEPFVRKDLIDILDFLTARGHPVFVTTNGWFLDRIQRLAELRRPDLLTVGVSIDGVGPTHDTIRRKGAFERSEKALEIARAAGCQVQVNTVVQPENLDTVEAIAEHFQTLGVHQVFIPLASFPGAGAQHLTPESYPSETIDRVARWSNSQPTDAKYVLSGGTFRITDCHAGSSSCYIDPEGDVYACMTRKELSGDAVYRIGGLRAWDLDFDALWASERARAVRLLVKSCPGCYAGCEISRETARHGLDGTIDAETLVTRLKAPTVLRLDDPRSSPYLTGDWYAIEDGFRWMGRRAGVRLMRPAGAGGIAVRLRAIHPDIGRKPLTVRVTLDGASVGKLLITAPRFEGFLEHHFPIRPLPEAGLGAIGLEVDRVWVPRDFGESVDRRRLGLMVEQLGFVSG